MNYLYCSQRHSAPLRWKNTTTIPLVIHYRLKQMLWESPELYFMIIVDASTVKGVGQAGDDDREPRATARTRLYILLSTGWSW